jgi:dihydroorotase
VVVVAAGATTLISTVGVPRSMPGRRAARGGERDGGDVRIPPAQVLAGRAWISGKLQPVEIGIGGDGRICRIARTVQGPNRQDFGERVIMPSTTDIHVHFRDPGGSADVENFESGTLQAALGGVGLVADMPNTAPPVVDREAVETKIARARGRLAVDAILYGLANTPRSIPFLASSVGAFKLYLSPTTGVAEPPEPTDTGLILDAVARTGLALSVHAEEPKAFHPRPDRPSASPIDWDEERPPEAEIRGVERVLPGPPALRLNIAHVTTRRVADRLGTVGTAFEVTPHHLLLAAQPNDPATHKVNPPLRVEAERRALWEAFCEGRIPMVASDHAPHSRDAKALPFARAPSGMPGVETTLPLLLAQVRAGALSFPVLLKAACDRPARWMGMPVGRLSVGHRANLLVVDFRDRRTISARHLSAPCGWTAFERWEGIFPQHHFRDGQPIVLDGEFVGDRRGAIVRPEYAPGADG